MTSTEQQNSNETRIRVKFFTQQEKYRVPSDPIFLPINLKRLGLSTVINHLLSHENPVPFEFLINGQILKGSIDNYLKTNNLSTENVLELEYLESVLPPTPQAQFQHDDWVSTIDQTTDKLIATGSYDNVIRLWNKSGEVVDSLSYHNGPIKSINWIDNDNNVAFLSASLDQTIVAWKKNDSGSYDPLYTAIGHTKSVESVKASPNLVHFATSSLDGTIKLWNLAGLEEDEHHVANRPSAIIKPSAKKSKVRHELCKTSIMTLSDHKGPIPTLQFHNTSASVLFSGGWDHSLRTWDLGTETNINIKNCEKPFNSLHINSSNSLLASGHTDRIIRLWDTRVSDNTVMKLGLVGHSNWVSQVQWNQNNDSQLVSSSYDGTVRGWDIRSKTPIFTLPHNAENPESKVLCVNWFDNLIVSGGDDQVLGIHKVNDQSNGSN